MSDPAVSIIVNAYNGEAYLRETLESVLEQDWSDWELILWDDRSTDGTADVIRTYSDSRIRYLLAETHTPLGRAREEAIARARGEWIAFLDQDDVWSPGKLSRQMSLARNSSAGRKVGLVYGRAELLHTSGRRSVHDHRHEHTRLPEGDIFDRLLIDSCYIGMSTVMVRAEAYRAVGGIDARYEFAIDYDLFLRLAERYDALALQEVCCAYRVHAASLTSTKRAEVHREVITILEGWRGRADRALLEHRLRVHQSLLAVEEIRAGRLGPGGTRLLRKGSLPYVASRPLARLSRRARRLLRPTDWHERDQRV